MTIKVIKAGPAHAPAMAAIHAAAFAGGEVWPVAVIAAQLGLPATHGFIAPEGGMALLRAVPPDADILTIAVAPDARRQGVGRALLRQMLTFCHAKDIARLLLEVSVDNDAARALYAAMGAQEIGRRRRYYADGTDALLLALPVP